MISLGTGVRKSHDTASNSAGEILIVTTVEYMYRDAGNYKFYGTFIVSGSLEKSEVAPYLIHLEYFVPSQVGLASLVPVQMNSDDHLLHEFVSFRCSEAMAGFEEQWTCKDDFISKFKNAEQKGWFQGIDDAY